MKQNILWTGILLLLSLSVSNAQTGSSNVTFEVSEVDLGKLCTGEDFTEVIFKGINTTKDTIKLMVWNTSGFPASYTREPIPPGGELVIRKPYVRQVPGSFQKSLTVEVFTMQRQEFVFLSYKGEVVECKEPTPEVNR